MGIYTTPSYPLKNIFTSIKSHKYSQIVKSTEIDFAFIWGEDGVRNAGEVSKIMYTVHKIKPTE
jgi:pyridoxine/pyridoxamine 5'-phosphate oxidase